MQNVLNHVNLCIVLFGCFIGTITGVCLVKIYLIDNTVITILAAFGAYAGLLCCLILSSILNGAVTAVFVLFGECPNALQDHHQEEFHSLTSTWDLMYPTSISFTSAN